MSSPLIDCSIFTRTILGCRVVRWLTAAILATTLLVISACAADSPAQNREEETSTTRELTTTSSSDSETYLVERKLAGGEEVRLPRQKFVKGLLYSSVGGNGRLEVGEGGCLRRNGRADGAGPVIVWPPGFGLSVEGDEISVLNEKGKVVARVGDLIKVGGSTTRSLDGQMAISEQLRRQLPERCPGLYQIADPEVRVIGQE